MDQMAEQNVVETETTQTASPPVEAPVTEQTAEPVSTPEGELPDVEKGMSEEARKAFQEQRLEIKRLKEESEAREKSESAFQVFKPQPQDVDINQFADAQGQVNWTAYNNAVAQRARFEASQAAEEKFDELNAKKDYPELFSNPRTEKLIAAQWLYEKMAGKPASIYAIAKDFSKDFEKAVTKAEKSGAEKMLTQVSQKEQAAVTPSQTSSNAKQAMSNDELEKLRRQSRGRGSESDDAIAQRMKGIPWK